MPGFDGTGPLGRGPRTGWGRGNCPPARATGSPSKESADNSSTQEMSGAGRGGRPWGGGRGRCFGGGRGQRFNPPTTK